MRCYLLDTCNKIKIFLSFTSLVLSCLENYLMLGLSWSAVPEIECQTYPRSFSVGKDPQCRSRPYSDLTVSSLCYYYIRSLKIVQHSIIVVFVVCLYVSLCMASFKWVVQLTNVKNILGNPRYLPYTCIKCSIYGMCTMGSDDGQRLLYRNHLPFQKKLIIFFRKAIVAKCKISVFLIRENILHRHYLICRHCPYDYIHTIS
jgi:hypothetical protein